MRKQLSSAFKHTSTPVHCHELPNLPNHELPCFTLKPTQTGHTDTDRHKQTGLKLQVKS